MVIDINLLEEKAKPNRMPWLITGIGLLFLFLIGGCLLWQNYQLTEEETMMMEELDRAETIAEDLQMNIGSEEHRQQVILQETLLQLKNKAVPVPMFIEKVVALLPQRGYIQSFLLEGDQIELQVRFDSMQGVATYLDAMSDQPFLRSVELERVLTTEVSSELSKFEYRPRYVADYSITINEANVNKGAGENEVGMES